MSQLYPSALSSGIRIAIKKNVNVPSPNVPKQTTIIILQKKHNVSCPKCRNVQTNQPQLLKNGTQKTSCPKCRNVSTEQAPLLRKETNKTRLSRMSPASQAGKRLFSEKCPECPRHSKQAGGIMMPCPECPRCPKQANIHSQNERHTKHIVSSVSTVPLAPIQRFLHHSPKMLTIRRKQEPNNKPSTCCRDSALCLSCFLGKSECVKNY